MKKLILFACLALNINAFAQIPTDGLIGYWPFNGNVNDESGNENNGTIHGSTFTNDRFGTPNSACHFNGINNYISVANSSSLQVSHNVTICAWVKIENPDSTIILVKGNYGNLWDYGLSTSWSYPSYESSGNPMVIDEYRNRNDKFNQWHFFAATVDEVNGNQLKLYIDGQEMIGTLDRYDKSSKTDDYIRPTTGNLLIGSNSHNYFTGDIDDIRIYNRTLNSSEISSLFYESICRTSITVTDTLVINANITGFNPVKYSNTIKVYPNPTKDAITIDCGNNYGTLNGYTIKITNSLSQTVYTSKVNQQSTSIKLNSWTGKGIYFVHLIDASSNTIDIKKIVLQ